MAKLSDIYGIDENAMASRIASEALNPAGAKEDFHGATFDQSARSKGNLTEVENETAKATNTSGKDSRAKSEGN